MAHRDFEELIIAFNAEAVRYLVIGAHAVAFHARPRATKDLDLYIDPTAINARRVLEALRAFFGGTPPAYSIADLVDPDLILQLGVAPVRVDLLSAVAGVRSFAAAWRRRCDGRFGSAPAHYLSLADLIAAKTASSRAQDLADLVSLRRAVARRR